MMLQTSNQLWSAVGFSLVLCITCCLALFLLSYVYDITSEQLIVYFSPLLKRYSKTSSLGRTSARPSSPEIQRSSVDSRSSSSRHNPHTLLQVGSHHWLNRSISRQNLQRKKWKMSSLDDVVVLHACELTFTTCTCLFWLCRTVYAYDYPVKFLIIETAFNIFFIFHFLLRFLGTRTAKHLFFTSIYNLIDISSIILFFRSMHLQPAWLSLTFLRAGMLPYIFKMSRNSLCRPFRLSQLGFKLLHLAISMLSILFLFASSIFVAEKIGEISAWRAGAKEANITTMFESVYFVLVTLTTVGYGDYTATTSFGRLLVVFFILIGVIGLTETLTEVVEVAQAARNKNKLSIPRFSSFVLVCGSPSVRSLQDFILEIYHEDHDLSYKDRRRQVCILIEDESKISAIRTFLKNRRHLSSKVSLLCGSVSNSHDLIDRARSKSEALEACFVMSDSGNESERHTENTIAQALLLTRTVAEKTPILMMLGSPRSRYFVESLGLSTLCVYSLEVKLSLLAMSCIAPGLTTLLFNLLKTRRFDPTQPTNCSSRSSECLSLRDSEKAWKNEYEYGASHEFYTVQLAPEVASSSATLSELCRNVYGMYEVLVVAVRDERSGTFYSDPITRIDKGTSYFALVIAQNAEQTESVGTPINREHLLGRALCPTAPFAAAAHGGSGAVNARQGEAARLRDTVVRLKAPPVDISGHIVVMCESTASIESFLGPLRTREQSLAISQTDEQKIVIVCIRPYDTTHFRTIADTSRMYFLRGSAMHQHVLEQARVRYASNVVILSRDNITRQQKDVESSESDSYTIVSWLRVSKYLEMSAPSPSRSCSGSVFVVADLASEAESIPLCLQTPEHIEAYNSHRETWRTRLFASGAFYSRNTPHSLLYSSFWNSEILCFYQHLMRDISTAGILSQYPIPSQLWATSNSMPLVFGTLLEHLTGIEEIPLALYRNGFHSDCDTSPIKCKPLLGGCLVHCNCGRQTASHSLPYVLTCPPASLELCPFDRVFVIQKRFLSAPKFQDNINDRGDSDMSAG